MSDAGIRDMQCDALRARLAASHPGPWQAVPDVDRGGRALGAFIIQDATGRALARWQGERAQSAHRLPPDVAFVLHAAADCAWLLDRLPRNKPLALTAREDGHRAGIRRRVQRSAGDRWYAYYEDDDRMHGAVGIFTAPVPPRHERRIARWLPLDESVPYFLADSCEDPHLLLVLEASEALPRLLEAVSINDPHPSAHPRILSARAALFGRSGGAVGPATNGDGPHGRSYDDNG